MKMATTWSGALALAALISLPLQAAEPVKVGSKIDTEGALLGNMISVAFCPYARLTSYLVDDWRKDPDADGGSDVDYPIVEGYAGVFAAALVYRAVVVGAVVLAFCLGL